MRYRQRAGQPWRIPIPIETQARRPSRIGYCLQCTVMRGFRFRIVPARREVVVFNSHLFVSPIILLSVKDVVCTYTNWSAEIDIIIYIFSDPSREQFLVLCSPLEQLESPPVSTSDARNPPRAHNRLYFFYGHLKCPTAYRRLHTSIPAKTNPPLSTAVTPADKNTPITVLAHRGSNAQSLLIPKNKTGPCSLDSRLSEAS